MLNPERKMRFLVCYVSLLQMVLFPCVTTSSASPETFSTGIGTEYDASVSADEGEAITKDVKGKDDSAVVTDEKSVTTHATDAERSPTTSSTTVSTDDVESRTCSSDLCVNGGACVSDSSKKFTCICPQGFEGRQCRTDIDECQVNPDTNSCKVLNRECINLYGSFECGQQISSDLNEIVGDVNYDNPDKRSLHKWTLQLMLIFVSIWVVAMLSFSIFGCCLHKKRLHQD